MLVKILTKSSLIFSPVLLIVLLQVAHGEEGDNTLAFEVDHNGYIAYCPCMGRFGNQADQFLGSLAFAKEINRTLILPPWVEYIPYQTGSIQVPFDKYFRVSTLQEYHRVITMADFMTKLAPAIWPPGKRVAFCYMVRGTEGKGCDAKDGNPFGPFWDNFNVDFVGSEIFGPDLHYLSSFKGGKSSWNELYTGEKWPVLAFVGPPSAFPVEQANVHIQKYLSWTDDLMQKAKKFIKTLPKGPFIGIHLRNGADWSRVCELVDENETDHPSHLFSSPQCLGYRHEHGRLTTAMCYPPTSEIVKQLKRAVKSTGATSVFVASDRNHLMTDLSVALKRMDVNVAKLDYNDPHVDLVILGQSNLFIGNCISSFSAFVKRERDTRGFPSQFWAFPSTSKDKKHLNPKDEL